MYAKIGFFIEMSEYEHIPLIRQGFDTTVAYIHVEASFYSEFDYLVFF